MDLTVLSYNIHKGFDFLSRKLVLTEIRALLRDTRADIVCLQEVLGAHQVHGAQMEFLADSVWTHYSYGKNAVYEEGHHGNCILSKYPITETHNHDLSQHRYERRGLLMAKIGVPESGTTFSVLTTHLNLLERHRTRQVPLILDAIKLHGLEKGPLLLCGDFNDWRNSLRVGEKLELSEVPAQSSFPSIYPCLPLDRVYYRDFGLVEHKVLSSNALRKLSDHLPVLVKFRIE